MSSALAIASVSAVLCNLLDDGMVEKVGGALGSTVSVTAIAPDIIELGQPDTPPSLNLFMYRVSPNRGLWNTDLPSMSSGGDRLGSPPLALDLHYLLTAYGKSNFQAEVLLGYAMQLLHERPVLDRATLRQALSPSPLGSSVLPPSYSSLDPSDLADQAEAITITMEASDTEDLSRLWTAIQAPYRPSVNYHVSVVLIQEDKPKASGLPVLTRGVVDPATGRDRGPAVNASTAPPLPFLAAATPLAGQAASRLGEPVVLTGGNLAGTGVVATLSHPLLDQPIAVALADNDDPTSLTVPLPTAVAAASNWPAGTYAVSVSLTMAAETEQRTTNLVPLALAPTIALPPATLTRNATTGDVTLEVKLSPPIHPHQQVWLYLGGIGAPSAVGAAVTPNAKAVLPSVASGDQWVRAQVDGVMSLLTISGTPPKYDATQTVSVPA